MASTLILTPCRSLDFDDEEVKSLMTPEVKKDLRHLFDDDDSGLGIDDHLSPSADFKVSTRLDFSNVFATPGKHIIKRNDTEIKRSLFSGKRFRDEADDFLTPSPKAQKKNDGVFSRTMSCGERPILRSRDLKAAVNRLVEEDLVGDATETFCLPTIRGKHQDLKSISVNTMTDLLTERYDDVINNYRIIDCRYPYEYEGGHIKDAENRYTRDQIQQLLHETPTRDVTGKRNILIFHCEFSSERGPKMMRFLRSQDRTQNEANYPSLTFPEVYLLDGGYKAFYHTEKTLCHPQEYKPMLHPGHSEDLRHFRTRSKSWSAGNKKRTLSRRRQ
ncbi:M-phase inducer phosphatase-like [Ylistrum balloti]|uniref:M-phase inducer phosphatase-like n=1 Tax=Ylistrum balloti TaxID=509963 RepID=UPI002905E7EC|nr:M-phase inducer phosphatase-like [Ylistrum balloti]